MKINIQSIHFDASEKLNEFIEKKVTKLGKFAEGDAEADVVLKVVKPQTAMNKEVVITIGKLRAEKVADTFEEAIDHCADALKTQLEKLKNK